MKIGILLLLFLTQKGLAQSDTLLTRYQLRYPLSKNVLAEAPLQVKPVITAATLLTIPANAEVTIIQKDKEFYKVIYNNRAGYVLYAFLEKDHETFKRRNYPHKPIEESNSELPALPQLPPPAADAVTWYGKVNVLCPIQKEPNSRSKNLANLPRGTIIKIQRYDYSYWQVELNGKIGYAGVYYIGEISKSANPFISTRYTGPTFDRYEAATRESNPTNGLRPSMNRQGGKSPVQPNQ